MGMTYFRRFRMEFDIASLAVPEPVLPDGYEWVAWHKRVLERHALVKFQSFHSEIDARVFPCLAEIPGCSRLMSEIARQKTFLPGATWLISFRPNDFLTEVDCGTIQGMAHSRVLGAIQNVGVVPEHRGFGLGKALVLKALQGFRAAGLRRAYLEVTADNQPAVELYRSLGFRLTRTMYKAVQAEPAPSL